MAVWHDLPISRPLKLYSQNSAKNCQLIREHLWYNNFVMSLSLSLVLHVIATCILLDVPASCGEVLRQLGWQHRISLNTSQLVVCIDVNDGTQSAGVRLAISDLKVETDLEFSNTGLHITCFSFSISCNVM